MAESILPGTLVSPQWLAAHLEAPGLRVVDIRGYVKTEDLGDGQVWVSKRYVATGPISLAFRCWFGPSIRRAMPASFTALAAEAARLRAAMSA